MASYIPTPTLSIKSLHQEYQLWMKELLFCKEQISTFEHHLQKLSLHIPFSAAAEIEKYQNRFICQKEVIDILKHDLNVSERQLAAFVRDLSGGGIETMRMDNHVKLRDRMATFRKLFKELKDSFHAFESKMH